MSDNVISGPRHLNNSKTLDELVLSKTIEHIEDVFTAYAEASFSKEANERKSTETTRP